MKLVIQRVKNAKVEVEGNIVGKIGKGFLVLVGITHTDTKKEADYLVKKLCKLRIFEDENGKMNLGLKDVGGELLIISQFTLYANCKSGNRPSFIEACEPKKANEMYEYFKKTCSKELEKDIQSGIFGADMKVELLNDGPVTIILDSEEI